MQIRYPGWEKFGSSMEKLKSRIRIRLKVISWIRIRIRVISRIRIRINLHMTSQNV